MANPFDQFDAVAPQSETANPFDQFDSPATQAPGVDLSYALEMEDAPKDLTQSELGNGKGLVDYADAISGAALGLASGATGGMAGQLAGTVEGIVKEIASGNFGTQEAADRIEQLAMERAQQLTYQPRTEAGQEALSSIGEFLQPLEAIPPIAQAQTIAAAARPSAQQAASSVRSAVPAAVSAASPAVKKVADQISGMAKKRLSESEGRSVGAAETPQESQRAVRSQIMPVPFEGESALTKGQATRNFEQLQFEKETAKQGDVGAPLRERSENQINTLVANLDAISDLSDPANFEYRDIGRGIDKALTNRHKAMKKQERKLYDEAEASGEMRSPVKISGVPSLVEFLNDAPKSAGNASDILRLAEKRGIIRRSKQQPISKFAKTSGEEVAPTSWESGDVTLSRMEKFRQEVNDVTDLSNSKEARVRSIVLSAIDDATENAGGDAYKKARRYSSNMRRQFENTGITKKLLSDKRGTTERQISYEDAFKKIMLDSPIEEINKLRGTLLRSGDEGKQAWADLKAKGVEYIKENATSRSESLEGGAPVISVNKLNKAIQMLDDKGKLESIYGKKNAQVLRDLGDIAKDIMTAPPGSVNFSNTASALQVVMDSIATGAVSGVPLPVVTALREAGSAIKNKKTRTKINRALNYLKEQE